jgi:hypothetical protein
MKLVTATMAAALVLVGTAAFAQKVTTDSDPAAPYATYKTYAWAKGTASPNPLGEKRIHDGVDAKMKEAGFTLVTENPSVFVATHAVAKEEKELITMGMGGYGRWGYGGGTGTTSVNTYLVGTLAVDMYDAKTKNLVWRGIATDTLSDKPEKNADKVEKSLEKMFKEYPPKAKK